MKNTIQLVTTVAVLTATSLLHAQDTSVQDVTESDRKTANSEKTEWLAFNTQNLDKIFGKSMKEFEGKALESSADLIAKASVMVSNEAGLFPLGDDRKYLKQNSKSLRTLSTRVREGIVKDSSDLKQAFAKTHHFLSGHYITLSKGAKGKKQGSFLLGAIHHAEQAVTMAGDKVSKANRTLLDNIQQMAADLANGGFKLLAHKTS